ncbi:HlyD family secretion protein [Xanthomarina sp. F2636L]|uniref:HlyD family secretion protein n=1 Tax=Xanthomarina sp. F2636L TaxID=2996018 RepID=UPI00225DF4EF|nr:HlyD family secretion protein [Xanthomarina sp. F2636L]MCX7550371.1 HlyD family secretion protein [Xanthomarina sp. F2636L]
MKSKKASAKKISILVIVLTFIIMLFNVLSSRFTPSTNQTRVHGLNLSLAPMVSGYITRVDVSLHSQVKEGDTLFIIDRKPYEIAVTQAEINLENVIQNLTAGLSGLKAATAQLNSARVKLDRAKKNWERTQRVMAQNEGALSEADRDRSESSYLTAIEHVATAKANLEGQKTALGPTDAKNPLVKAAINQLEKANWDLEHTVITAPSDGVIESFNVETGYFASAGHAIASLISNKTIWIQANFTENNLTHLKVNDEAGITFDIDAGEVYKAKVTSIAYGVKTQNTNAGDLPTVRSQQGWLREQQRFPVIIALEDQVVYKKLRQGSQANVVVYTGDSFVLNTLAKFKIWLTSKFSYVR